MRHGLNTNKVKILVVGVGFIGVEWTTRIDCFYPDEEARKISGWPHVDGNSSRAAAGT